MDFLKDNWQIFALIALAGGSFAIPGVRGIMWAIGQALISEKVIKWIVLRFLEALVKSTKNKFDDELLEKVKEKLNEK